MSCCKYTHTPPPPKKKTVQISPKRRVFAPFRAETTTKNRARLGCAPPDSHQNEAKRGGGLRTAIKMGPIGLKGCPNCLQNGPYRASGLRISTDKGQIVLPASGLPPKLARIGPTWRPAARIGPFLVAGLRPAARLGVRFGDNSEPPQPDLRLGWWQFRGNSPVGVHFGGSSEA